MPTPTVPDSATLTVQLGPFLADLGSSLGVLLADHLQDPLPLVDAVAHAAFQALTAHQMPGPAADADLRTAAHALLATRERRVAVARDVRQGRCKAARLTEARQAESKAATVLRAALAAETTDHPRPHPNPTGDPR